ERQAILDRQVRLDLLPLGGGQIGAVGDHLGDVAAEEVVGQVGVLSLTAKRQRAAGGAVRAGVGHVARVDPRDGGIGGAGARDIVDIHVAADAKLDAVSQQRRE